VKRGEPEFEIDFIQDGEDGGTDTYHAHVRCFTAWTWGRDQPDSARPSSSAMNRD
jgi:hypothetical protein